MRHSAIPFEKLMTVLQVVNDEGGTKIYQPMNGYVVVADVSDDLDSQTLVLVEEFEMQDGNDWITFLFADTSALDPEHMKKTDVVSWIEGIYKKV